MVRALTYIITVIAVSAVDLDGDHHVKRPVDAIDRFFQRTAGEREKVVQDEKEVVRVNAHGETEEMQKPMMRSQSSSASDTVLAASSPSLPAGSKLPPIRLLTSLDAASPAVLMADHQSQNQGQFPGVGASGGMNGGSGFGAGGGAAPGAPGNFQMSPCEIPQWLSGDYLCTEAASKNEKVFKMIDPVTGKQKYHMRDGAVCTTQCDQNLWYDEPVISNLTCTHGYWLDSRQSNIVVFKCQMSNIYRQLGFFALVLACLVLYCGCQVRQGKNPMEFMRMKPPPAPAAAAAASSPSHAAPKGEEY